MLKDNKVAKLFNKNVRFQFRSVEAPNHQVGVNVGTSLTGCGVPPRLPKCDLMTFASEEQ